MKEATPSHVAMLRGAIAMAWADGSLDPDEQQRLHAFIDQNTQLSPAQKDMLHAEIDAPVTLDQVWSQITEAQDRAHLINIATLIFWEDEHYSEAERKAYAQMNAWHNQTLDISTIRLEMETMAEKAKEHWEMEKAAEKESQGFVERVVGYLDRLFGYPLT
jgi:uncharacterized membrane protein YebE (DUF533 family)